MVNSPHSINLQVFPPPNLKTLDPASIFDLASGLIVSMKHCIHIKPATVYVQIELKTIFFNKQNEVLFKLPIYRTMPLHHQHTTCYLGSWHYENKTPLSDKLSHIYNFELCFIWTLLLITSWLVLHG